MTQSRRWRRDEGLERLLNLSQVIVKIVPTLVQRNAPAHPEVERVDHSVHFQDQSLTKKHKRNDEHETDK
jgi:hypothetical protein